MDGIPKSPVNQLREQIDEHVHTFPNRPMEGDWLCGRVSADGLCAALSVDRCDLCESASGWADHPVAGTAAGMDIGPWEAELSAACSRFGSLLIQAGSRSFHALPEMRAHDLRDEGGFALDKTGYSWFVQPVSVISGKASTIRTVELARGIAAMLVVIFHANASADEFGGPHWTWLSFGEHGVDFFFVLSGFIITIAHETDLGQPGMARTYLLKRGIRLLPPLWIIVFSWAILRTVIGIDVEAGTVARSMLLWPSTLPTMPAVVWTLRHEVLFYVMFVLVIINRRLGIAAFALWGMAAGLQLALAARGRAIDGLPAFFLSTFTLDFMLGMLIAQLHRRKTFSTSFAPLAAALCILAALLVLSSWIGIHRDGTADYISIAATWWTLLLGLAFAGVLHGLVRIESRVRVPKAGVFIGAASYAIYLLHTIVNSFSQRVAAHLPPGLKAVGAGHLLLIVTGTISALIFYRLIERPATRALRKRLLPARPS